MPVSRRSTVNIYALQSNEAAILDKDRGPNEPAVSGGFGSHAFSHKGNGAT
jgi:hypothetical protein